MQRTENATHTSENATQRTVFFFGHAAGELKYMSNFYPCKFSMAHDCIDKADDVYTYPTSEHAIMHIKACLMGDNNIAEKILSADKPLVAKRLGRKVKPWDENKWKSNVEFIAYSVLIAKFSQNNEIAQKLLGTGDKIIAEANPRDKLWGIGIGAIKAKQGEKWKGQNILGKALMKVRAELRGDW